MALLFNNQNLIAEFVSEGQAHVAKIEAGLLAAEQGRQDADSINAIFRSAHSIKGTAGFFGLKNIVELAHGMENLLAKIRNNELKLDLKLIEVLLGANDKLKEMIENVASSESVDIAPYIHKLNIVAGEAGLAEPAVTAAAKQIGCLQQISSAAAGSYKNLIREAVKHGHKFYKLSINFNSMADGEKKRIATLSNIKLIGNLIAGDNGISEEISELLFSSVLEKDLIMMGLDLGEADNVVLEQYTAEEVTQLLEAAQKEQVRPEDLAADSPSPAVCEQERDELFCKPEIVSELGEVKYSGIVKEDERIRVNVTLLDNLVNLASELVLGRNQLLRILQNHVEDIGGLSGVLQNIDRITTELQEKVMRTRMQPLANVFAKIPRLVRELAKSTEKKVELQIEGGQVELDKSIIEGLADPLTHLVRNALDHGIEVPEIRKAAGKPASAALGVMAYQEGGRVIIDIKDDGAGIDVEKIKQRALKQGMVSKAQLSSMNERDLLSLIFLPGFSTAERVTDISGRGVGLDVAKANIEKLGGTIEVYTTRGIGTTIRLILPLTLAIIPSIIVEVSGYRFALPQINLQEIVRIKPGDSMRKIEFIHNQMLLRMRDKLVPVMSLTDFFGMTAPAAASTGLTKVVILKNSRQSFGLIVDAIHDREEILVKPVPRYLKESKGYSGITILGDGRIAMVLDVDGIAAAVKFPAVKEQAVGQIAKAEGQASDKAITEQEILLFKCSGPEILGLNLTQVARVAEIDASQLEPIGDKEYANLNGNVLRIVRPEDFLPISKTSAKQHKQRLIIPKQAKYPLALLVEKIQDTIQVVGRFQAEGLKTKGILGSIVVNGRIVLMVNLDELLALACPAHDTPGG